MAQGIHRAKLIIASSEGGAYVFNLIGEAGAPALDGFITNCASGNDVAEVKPKSAKPKKGVEQIIAQAAAPECTNIITVTEISAYTPQKIIIPLHNWENVTQRFVIYVEDSEPSFQFICPEFIDLPPRGNERLLEVQFIAYLQDKEYNGFLTLTNQNTKEFIRY